MRPRPMFLAPETVDEQSVERVLGAAINALEDRGPRARRRRAIHRQGAARREQLRLPETGVQR